MEDGAFSWCRYDEAGEPSRDECLKNDNFGKSLLFFKIFQTNQNWAQMQWAINQGSCQKDK